MGALRRSKARLRRNAGQLDGDDAEDLVQQTFLDIPEGTVRSRLRRGRELLREALAELTTSREGAATTMTNIEGWAEEIRERVLGPRAE